MVYWECLQLRRAINAVPYKTSNLPKHYEICSYYLVIWFLSINFVDDSVYIGMPKVGHTCKSKIFQLIRDIRRQNKQTNRKQQFTTYILFVFPSWIFPESWRRKRLRQMSCLQLSILSHFLLNTTYCNKKLLRLWFKDAPNSEYKHKYKYSKAA